MGRKFVELRVCTKTFCGGAGCVQKEQRFQLGIDVLKKLETGNAGVVVCGTAGNAAPTSSGARQVLVLFQKTTKRLLSSLHSHDG